jgi:hypothetical protein
VNRLDTFQNRQRRRVNVTTLVIGLVIAFLMLGATVILIIILLPPSNAIFQPTPVIVVISAPTATPTQNPLLLPTSTPLGAGEQSVGGLFVGMYVQISGTGVEGLRFHASPGINSAALFFGAESEVFLITKGPQSADGYTWWFLTAPYDQNRSGWAVMEYLTPVPTPSP